MQDIKALWEAHEKAVFPASYRGKALQGVDLTELHSEAGGCVVAFLMNEGSLGQRRMEVLKQCQGNLSKVVKELDPAARKYFEELRGIVDKVLKASGDGR